MTKKKAQAKKAPAKKAPAKKAPAPLPPMRVQTATWCPEEAAIKAIMVTKAGEQIIRGTALITLDNLASFLEAVPWKIIAEAECVEEFEEVLRTLSEQAADKPGKEPGGE